MRKIICPININAKAKAKTYFRGINFTLISVSTVGNQPAPYRGLSGPPGRNAKKVSKMSPRAPGPETPKSLKKVSGTVRQVSGESPESVWRVLLDCSGTFWRLFGAPGPEAPGDIFETFSAFRARRARETSVRGGLVPKSTVSVWSLTAACLVTEHMKAKYAPFSGDSSLWP